ncbi:hypothetical protein Y032_0013g1957 [Ancylostoma ceylanicum]|uniref:Uncharacterized protein n=1 Tax=Ancylostoma ceylanicum TaxID=53326 RepID=A0A016VAW9_9BILA|nr:hypothetical protein Y032_0013g1957 [Ancylostoma ceylanicum]
MFIVSPYRYLYQVGSAFNIHQPDRPANAGLSGFFLCSLRSRCLLMTSPSHHAGHSIFNKTPVFRTFELPGFVAPFHICETVGRRSFHLI